MKLYGMPMATCTMRVKVMLYELDEPFTLEVVNLFTGEHKTPEFLKKQPFGKVPVFEDGEVLIFESRAILRYLAKKFVAKKNLLGESVKEQAVIDNWLEAEAQNYNLPVAAIVEEKVFQLWRGEKPDEAVVAKNLKTLEGVLDAYEAVLSDGRPFIAGEKFSIADIAHLPYTWRLTETAGIKEPIEKRPLVKAWWERISSRDSWKKVVAEAV